MRANRVYVAPLTARADASAARPLSSRHKPAPPASPRRDHLYSISSHSQQHVAAFESALLDPMDDPQKKVDAVLAQRDALQILLAQRKALQAHINQQQTALVEFDARMVAHACPTGHHPDQPERIVEVHRELLRQGLAAHYMRVPSRLVTREEVMLVHESRHW